MRERLLDVAAHAFQARGYHSTTMHEVMAEAGVTGGAMYHHFPTKKALGLAVIRERVAAAVDGTWFAPLRTAATAAAAISAVFGDIAQDLDRQGAVSGCPLNNLALELALADGDFQAALHDLFESWRRAVCDKLAADQRAGLLDTSDVEGLATFVIAAYSGAMTLAKASQSSQPLRTCAAQVQDALMRLAPAPAERGSASRFEPNDE